MIHILMTGISGFMGGALAAGFLKNEGVRIYALVKSDIDKERTLDRIRNGLYAQELDSSKIDGAVEFIEYSNLDDCDHLKAVIGDRRIDEIWHIAAHMSYDPQQYQESFTVNCVGSTALMMAASESRHYYFISTTGVAGTGSGRQGIKEIEERLLDGFEAANPYTLSKVLAEYMLWNKSRELSMPLTIIRPGSIIGSSDTGWVNDTKYGYYSYLHILKRFKDKGEEFYLDIDPDKKFPVIHIDHLVDLCIRLRKRVTAAQQEIFHAVNQNLLTAREHFEIFKKYCNCNLVVKYGVGTQGFNKIFNRMNRDNNRFLGVHYSYSNKNLSESIGEENLPPLLTEKSIANVMVHYMKDK